ncbi:mycofactocin biosynthesis peptidyl-dipeptidase MftE [Georgenia sp. TF02-10]|uniref:mycofactocin biosynthesis peptidyl-dipeptidase MftE n=1 Tax=Georgenia sp. TF02-10 TaxID=2917725 RepID=UPI001FA7ED49|nr:mycofactocin biosynthesis peptidyl-dipeptidase MftE [Georgenia sp. TF02-10]UNX54212.1 mycofactocin biosynthesis peptidyl-dipeptidase MftE [Georgenia sp. TF02-10]
MVRLTEATWTEVDGATRRVLVLPVGALEQHGPHLPLSTDARIAERVAAAVHEQRPAAGLAPVLCYGASGEHADFPGTVSIGGPALQAVVVELVRHVTRDWPVVLVVNAHGGNAAALAGAQEVCRQEGRRLAVHHIGLPGMDAHAGRSETSLMLHLDPAGVRTLPRAAGVTQPVAELLPRLRTEGVRAVSPTGVLGDPRGATAEEGARLFAALVARATAAFDDVAGESGRTGHGAPDESDERSPGSRTAGR